MFVMVKEKREDGEKALLRECPCFPCLMTQYNKLRFRGVSDTTISWFEGQIEKCKKCMIPWIGQYDYHLKPENFQPHKESTLRCFTCLINECERVFKEDYPQETQLICLEQTRKCANCMLDNIEGILSH
jgi:hypothetical protein